MRFLTPIFLAGAALTALPVILHLLRRDVAARIPFTAVRLLHGTPLDRSRNTRLRDLLLLAARVVALLLLAASFARPYRPDAAGTSALTIVAVDRSFSMSASQRFERALTIARREIDAAGNGRVALLAFDDRADVIVRPGLAADARAALRTLSPSYGSTRYGAVFDRAAELTDSDSTRLVVVSDLQRSGFDGREAPLPVGIQLQVRDAGASTSNLAIDGLEIRDGRARVSVRNYGAGPAETAVRLEQGSQVVATRQVSVDARSSSVVTIEGVAAVPARASIDDPAGYAADNSRFAIPQSHDLPRVLVVAGAPGSSGGFYMTRALQAGGDGGADFEVRSMTGAEFAKLPTADVAGASAVVVLSTHAMQRRAAEGFRALFAAGGGVFVAAGPDVDPEMLSELLGFKPAIVADEQSGPGVLAVSDVRHPIFRPFDAVSANLAQVVFDREWHIAANASWRTVASFSTGSPALVEQSVGSGRVLLFASDVDRRWNDFPLHGAFVPFVQEAVHYVAARAAANDALLVGDLPDDAMSAPGIATIRGRLRAVNVDTRESDVERLTPSAFEHAVARTAASRPEAEERRVREREAAQGLWRYGLGLMLVTLVVEACVGAR